MKHRTNPVQRAISSGNQGKPATHRAAKGGAYRRHSKHKGAADTSAVSTSALPKDTDGCDAASLTVQYLTR